MKGCLLFIDSSKEQVIEKPSTPLLSKTTTTSNSSNRSSESDENSQRFDLGLIIPPTMTFRSYKSLAVVTGHSNSVSCLSLCGEFILSGSQGKDLIVWQQPDLRQITRFGQGDGSVKAVVSVGNMVFTAHQDMKIRVWKVSRKSKENLFRLVDTLPTTKDYLGKFMKQSNYVQSRWNHKHLWIEHADSISCLAIHNGMIYSGSWDKTIKIWRISDFKCLESIKAHDDAVNGLAVSNGNSNGNVFSASADGTIKVWGRKEEISHSLKGILKGHKDVSLNSVVVSEDGRIVYGGGSDGYIMGWLKSKDFDSWKLSFEVKGHEMAVLCMCLMVGRGGGGGVGGEFLCSGSADNSIGIWKKEMNGGLFRVGVIKGHNGPIRCLQASHVNVGGGFMLYSGSLDKTIRVWWVPGQ